MKSTELEPVSPKVNWDYPLLHFSHRLFYGIILFQEMKQGGAGMEFDLIYRKTFPFWNILSQSDKAGLLEYLRQKEENTIIIAGLQTDYCIDATIKAGFEYGFKMIVPSNANSTVDNPYMTAEQSYRYHNEFMWNKRYAECISFEETLKLMKERTD